ncbi:hypothetical protein [Streptomyces sp. PU-14G]|uniref:hypothetical protein n=1 Tax=Streptomyces sp. PU-14G TaxID=2800808 RepID=UPI0034DEB78B
MDLTPYVSGLRRELTGAAGAGTDEARALAERLVAPLESATRLVLLEALADAAEEISRALGPRSVDVRLRGQDPEFVVAPGPDSVAGHGAASGDSRTSGEVVAPTAGALPPAPESDGSGTSRVTFRLPNSLKSRVEQAAGYGGLSANAWLLRVVAAAVEADEIQRTQSRGRRMAERFTGWAR